MFSREWIEKFDASYGIPRKANEQYSLSYQAFWQWSADIGMCLFFITLGLLGSLLCLYAGILLDVYGLITLVFWAMAADHQVRWLMRVLADVQPTVVDA